MRWILALLVTVSATPAVAASPPDFEGAYSVALALKPGLDGPTCASYNVDSLRVEKGQIKTSAGQSLFSGTINTMGQLDGHMRQPDGADVGFEGHVQFYEYEPTKVHINAVIVDEKAGCGWTLSLVHQ